MKKIYKTITLVSLILFSSNLVAQEDSTLDRQVILEREYDPILKESSRLSTNPALYEPDYRVKEKTQFSEQAPILSFAHNKLGKSSSVNISTESPFKNRRGYLHAAAGTYLNVETSAGYRILDTKKDKLDIFASFDMSNGKVKYRHKGFSRKKEKAKYNDIRANIKYEHSFEPSIFSFDFGYAGLGYNYYGNPYLKNESSLATPLDLDSKQKVNVFSARAGLKSSQMNEGWLKYNGYVMYDRFKEDKGLFTSYDGRKGGILNFGVDLYTEYFADTYIGVRANVMNQSFGKNGQYTFPGSLHHSLTNITANPYYRFDGGNWMAELGVNINTVFDEGDKFVLTPNIKAHYNFDSKNRLYANIGGGVNDNTFLDILNENRYVIPIGRVKYSRTIYDLELGFKSGIVKGMEFDVFAGYKQTRDDHMFISSALVHPTGLPSMSWANTSLPVYGNVSTGHIGAVLKTDLIPYISLKAKMVGYFYNVKKLHGVDFGAYSPESVKAWGKPTFTTELTAEAKPIDKLSCSVGYLLALGRKTYSYGKTIDMKDINELNLSAEYQFTPWLSVNAKANNVLFQKYELVQGYTLQGVSFMAGFGLKF